MHAAPPPELGKTFARHLSMTTNQIIAYYTLGEPGQVNIVMLWIVYIRLKRYYLIGPMFTVTAKI